MCHKNNHKLQNSRNIYNVGMSCKRNTLHYAFTVILARRLKKKWNVNNKQNSHGHA
jgi:ABC-type uncharacterized transport system substrate-binding protein